MITACLVGTQWQKSVREGVEECVHTRALEDCRMISGHAGWWVDVINGHGNKIREGMEETA
jgi:hypothetical protein